MSERGFRRREVVGGAALLGAAGAAGLMRALPRGAGVLIFDSSHAASRAFALTHGAARRIDLAAEARTNWRGVRALGKGAAVAGYTGWDDYVAARGWLEGQGLRVVSEAVDRRRALVTWRMA